jgi:hypothetical protein
MSVAAARPIEAILQLVLMLNMPRSNDVVIHAAQSRHRDLNCYADAFEEGMDEGNHKGEGNSSPDRMSSA